MTNVHTPCDPKPTVAGYLLGIAVVALLVTAMLETHRLPLVYKDAVTAECRHVETEDNEAPKPTCGSLPEAYETIWVDPDWKPKH